MRPSLHKVYQAGKKVQKAVEALEKELAAAYKGKEIFLPPKRNKHNETAGNCCVVDCVQIHKEGLHIPAAFNWLNELQVTLYPAIDADLEEDVVIVQLGDLEEIKFIV